MHALQTTAAFLAFLALLPAPCVASEASTSSWSALPSYNTTIVTVGAALLGVAAGVVGGFTLLRRRALVGDALSHATLPGIAAAFLVATALGYGGKSLPLLLAGGAATGVLGVATIAVLRRWTILSDDAAMGVVLSVFFGAGVALLGVVQQLPAGHAAGLESFIYGKTAAMVSSDAWLIAGVAAACMAVSLLLFKELKLLAFDESFAGATGHRVAALDATLMAMVVAVTIVGLQAVGLVLMIALLVIPPAAARFWTDDLGVMTLLAAALGGACATVGALASAATPDLPSGATIVLVAAAAFTASTFFGSARGVLPRLLRRWKLRRRIAREHLLRGVYELAEHGDGDRPSATIAQLAERRSWSPAELAGAVNDAARRELVRREPSDRVTLTGRGAREAERLTRQHRLWELYLITHAEVAPSRVDRGADAIEHVLDSDTIAELEALLVDDRPIPLESPHQLGPQPEVLPGGAG